MNKSMLGIIIASLFIVTGFSSTDSSVDEQKNSYVLSTVGMLHDVVLNLLPSDVDKKLLLPAGTDPHVYVPTMQNIDDFNNAEMIYSVGLDLEAQMHPALLSLSKTKPVHFLGESLDTNLLIADGETVDPHVWFDLDLFSLIVDEVSQTLISNYPEFKSHVLDNTKMYKQKLVELDSYAKNKFSTLEPSQKWIVTTHDAFSYFARKYDFNVFTLKGVNTASDYSLLDKQRMEEIILDNSLKAIFIEDSVSNKDLLSVLENINKTSLDTQIGGYLYADSLGDVDSGFNTYESMFKYNVDTIFNALN